MALDILSVPRCDELRPVTSLTTSTFLSRTSLPHTPPHHMGKGWQTKKLVFVVPPRSPGLGGKVLPYGGYRQTNEDPSAKAATWDPPFPQGG